MQTKIKQHGFNFKVTVSKGLKFQSYHTVTIARSARAELIFVYYTNEKWFFERSNYLLVIKANFMLLNFKAGSGIADI